MLDRIVATLHALDGRIAEWQDIAGSPGPELSLWHIVLFAIVLGVLVRLTRQSRAIDTQEES